jgi:LPXTG-motif cell wall-anchored protein
MTSTSAVLGAVLPSTSTAADGFTALLGLGLLAVAAVFIFFSLRRRTT